MLKVWLRWIFGGWLIAVVVAGAFLRVQGIEQKSLWSDELFTLSMAAYHPLVPEGDNPWFRAITIFDIGDHDTFLTAKAAEQSPPLQDFLEKISIQFLGPTELGARLPGALAACILLAWFAWFAWHSDDPWRRRVLGWSLLFLAFSPALVAFAKDGRAYSLGATLVGMGGLLWMLRWQHGWRQLKPPGWGEITLFILACYTHYNAAALVAILLVPDAVVATWTRSRQAWLRLLVLGGVFLCWLALSAHTILFTAKGGVAWGHYSRAQLIFETVRGAVDIAHPAWLLLFLLVAWSLVTWHVVKAPIAVPRRALAVFFLMSIAVVYVAIAGKIVAKAGMAHPRYYIFIVPFLAVAFGIVFAELRHRWLAAFAAFVVVWAVARDLRHPKLTTYDEFRQMTLQAVDGSTKDTLFLFPWEPNRDLYRIYLERYLDEDMRNRMIGISSPGDVAKICDRLKTTQHVAVIAHGSGRQRIDEVYAACGSRWPDRKQHSFHNTFSEHWRTSAPMGNATR